MKIPIQSRKYLAIGFSTSLLLLFLLLSLNIKAVKAQEITATVTPTLVLENWFNTPTAQPLGSCPDQPVDPNHDLTTKYKNDCEQCLMTSTPAFPTRIPATSTGTVTAIPTKTITPSPTATMSFAVLEAREQFNSGIITTPLVPEDVEKHYASSGHVPNRGLNFYESSTTGSYTVGFQFWGSANVVNWFDQVQTIYYKIMSPKSPIQIIFYTGKKAGQTVNVPINTWYTVNVFSGKSGWTSWNETLDIKVNNQVTAGYSLYVIVDNGEMGTDPNDNYDIYYKWKKFGTFYFPPQDGYCRTEKLKSSGNDLWFNAKLYPFWVGTGGCITAQSVLGFLSSQWFVDFITAIGGTPPTIPQFSLCFREFSLSPIRLFGLNIDVTSMLYMIASLYIIKTLIDVA